MFRNVHYDKRKSEIHIWTNDKEGRRVYEKKKWTPYVFVPTLEGDITTVEGKPVKMRTFKHYWDYKKFCDSNTNIFENMVKEEIQYLCERTAGIADDDIVQPDLAIHTMDIEVHSDKGFPKPEDALWPVTAIAAHDSRLGKTYVFGIKEYTGKLLDDPTIKYYHAKDEKDLLNKYFKFINKSAPDVITGWNIYRFDMPYLFNRAKRLWGEKAAEAILSQISPIGITRDWYNGEHYNVDIAGISIVDYLPLYKKYSKTFLGVNLESYSLERVSQFELGEGKIDYSSLGYDLRSLFHEDWNLYVEYNVVDVKRIVQIEDKRKFISLVHTLALLSRCPIKFSESVTNLIEGLFLTYYRRNGFCAPYAAGGFKESFEAAHVKVPQRGFHKDVVDLDIVSSYPHAMITMNMGTETYFGTIANLIRDDGYSVDIVTEADIIGFARAKEFPPFEIERLDRSLTKITGAKLEKFNRAFKAGRFTIAPNGTLFDASKPGTIAAIERYVFERRKATKILMKEAEIASETDPSMKDQAERYKAAQLAYKLLINSIFGALTVPYMRQYNLRIAEAICACGRHSIKQGERFANEIMNDPTVSTKMVSFLERLKAGDKRPTTT